MKEEKYINEKLSHYDSPLDMDQVWDQLETALDKKDKKPKFLAFKKLLGLLSLALIVGSLVWCFSNYQDDKAQTTISSLNLPIESQTIESPVSLLRDAKESNTVLTNDASEVLTIKQAEKEVAGKKVAKINFPIKNSQTSTKATSLKKSASESNLPLKIQKPEPTNITSPINSKNESTNKTTKTTPSQHYNNNLALVQTNQSQIGNTPGLSKLQLSLLEYNRTQPKPHKLIKPHTPPPSLWSLDIYSGQSYSYANYSKNLRRDGVEITEFETLLESWIDKTKQAQKTTNNLSYGFAVKRKLVKNWYVESGINFFNHGTTFSYSDTIFSNSLTELDSTKFRRDIKAYNKINTLQIPLLVGKEFNMNKLSFNIAVGIGLNFLTNEQGYEFNLYNPSQAPTFEMRSYNFEGDFGIKAVLSGLAQMDIGYSLTEHIGLFSGLQIGRTKDLTAYYGEGLDVSSNFNYWGMRAGLRYTL